MFNALAIEQINKWKYNKWKRVQVWHLYGLMISRDRCLMTAWNWEGSLCPPHFK